MEKEFFENALKQKRYQNTLIKDISEDVNATQQPPRIGETQVNSHVEFYKRDPSDSPHSSTSRSPIRKRVFPSKIMKEENPLRRVATGTELATI